MYGFSLDFQYPSDQPPALIVGINIIGIRHDAPMGARCSWASCVVALACLATFFLAGQISRLLGHTGNIVLSPLLGVLLAAPAVQYVVDGIRAVVTG